MDNETISYAQIIFYIVSPLVTMSAVFVAYLALLKQSRPQVLIHYRVNPDVQTIIDLVIENLGNGMARDVTFSRPLPARCYGITTPDGEGLEILKDGIPAIAVGQKFIFDGGQYAGLAEKLGDYIDVEIHYKYKSPLGLNLKRKETCVLSISHLKNMTTRVSAQQAIVDALKSTNQTTLHKIEKQLRNINDSINNLANKLDNS